MSHQHNSHKTRDTLARLVLHTHLGVTEKACAEFAWSHVVLFDWFKLVIERRIWRPYSVAFSKSKVNIQCHWPRKNYLMNMYRPGNECKKEKGRSVRVAPKVSLPVNDCTILQGA
jgi:hypothetical protein